MSTTPLLETRNLYRLLPEGDSLRPVLKDVNLKVEEHTFVAVMGQSGSGKSTLLNVLSGLDTPTSGAVLVAGQELGKLKDEERTRLRRELIGFVFQFFNLVPNLTVAENVALPLLMAGVRRPRQDPRFQQAVEFFGIGHKLAQRPHELSGGEMQRTSIARALVHRPRIILADEPTGNLSSKAGLEVMQYLRRAVDELQQTALVVTHNPRDARFADTLHFLKDGSMDERASLRGEEIHEDRIAASLEELGI